MIKRMKVSEEWLGHAQDLKRIAYQIQARPTMNSEDHIEKLVDLLEDLIKEAREYAAECES